MKIESNKNWTTCLRLNTGDGSPRVFLLNSHFLGSVPLGFSYLLYSIFYVALLHPIKNLIRDFKADLCLLLARQGVACVL